MKKLLSLFTAAFMLLAAGCSQGAGEPAISDDDSVVLPPARIGEGSFSAMLAKEYTFETAFSDADAVARVKIGNWLSENTETHVTYFEAASLQCIKGDIPETFTLVQDGSSKSTMEGYPLFTYGNELLLFLNQSVNDENRYWIIGAFTTVMDVTYDSNGTRYYADRYGFLGETMSISANYANKGNTSSEVYDYAVKSNLFISDTKPHFYSYLFSEADVSSLIDSYKK